MQLDEIKRISTQMFDTDAKQSSKETTPPTISAAISDFAASLGAGPARYVPVVMDQFGLYGFCSDGVALRVRESGGYPVFGWTIWERPSVLYTAEFHAVWSSPDGSLYDITPKPAGETRIAFSPAPSFGVDFNFINRPTNRLRRAYVPVDPATIVATKLANLSTTQRAYEVKRATKAGLSLEQWIASRVPADNRTAIIDEYIELVEEAHGLSKLTPQGTEFSNLPRLRQIVARQRDLELTIRHY